MLEDRDTFTLAAGMPLVSSSRSSLAELKGTSDDRTAHVTGELLKGTNYTRFNCPYVFVAIVMNPSNGFPDNSGRPFNGGFNAGGGIVLLSSFALDKQSNFQSTLQHELGSAFGLANANASATT